MTTPLIRALKKAYPRGEITAVVDGGYEEVLVGNPYVDRVFTLDPEDSPFAFMGKTFRLARMDFDVTVDVLANPRSALISLFSGAPIRFGPDRRIRKWAYNRSLPSSRESSGYIADERLSVARELADETDGTDLDIFVDDPSRKKGDDLLADNGIVPEDGFVTVAPVSLRRWKLWPSEDYARVADYLIGERRKKVVLVGGPGESHFLESVGRLMRYEADAAIEFDRLKVLAHVLSRSTLHIGNNGGIQYLATAAKVPTITIFGPGKAETWNDGRNSRRVALSKEMSCRRPDCFRRCPYEYKCLRQVTFSDVKDAVDSLLV
ncbi:MAG: glycosyltransferase family 9 protein [Fidelibacterota bacterium]